MRTEKYINQILENCKKDLDSMGIGYGKNIALEIKRINNDTYGYTSWTGEKTPNTVYKISIDPIYLEEDVPETSVRGVLYHELLHTMMGSLSHDKKWMDAAYLVQEKFPDCPLGYQLGQAINKDIPVVVFQRSMYEGKAKYISRCSRCGGIVLKTRMSDFVKHAEEYSCPCGNRFCAAKKL